jgi:hypothetical protein
LLSESLLLESELLLLLSFLARAGLAGDFEGDTADLAAGFLSSSLSELEESLELLPFFLLAAAAAGLAAGDFVAAGLAFFSSSLSELLLLLELELSAFLVGVLAAGAGLATAGFLA